MAPRTRRSLGPNGDCFRGTDCSTSSYSQMVRMGQASHRGFDFVGHMRDHLHCLAEIVAPPLARDDLLVDAPARKIVGLRKRSVRESFVVPQVQIGLRAIVGDEDLAMLKRTHRSRIDVQVWIELLQRDLEPAAFKQAAEAGCRNPFPQG